MAWPQFAWPKRVLAMLILGGAMAWSASAQAQTAVPAPQPAPAAAQTAPHADDNPVGSVATLQGSASVTHANATHALALSDPVYKGDTLQTGVDGTLGITFDDETTFTMKPNARFAVDEFVYQEGGSSNAAAFNVFSGTVAFVAAEVAHTGDMKINTPTSSLGIRGTTGIVEVPEGGGAAAVSIKLYPDADGRIGRIEVFGRDGGSLGVLSRAATGFAVRPGAPGHFSAVPLRISSQEAERDRSFVRQTFTTRNVGRQINIQRRNLQQQRNQLQPNQRPGQPPGREQRPGQQRPELRTVPGGQPLPAPAGRPTLQQKPGGQPTPSPARRPTLQQQPGARPALQRPPGALPGGQKKPPPAKKEKGNRH
jgi:FecR protein